MRRRPLIMTLCDAGYAGSANGTVYGKGYYAAARLSTAAHSGYSVPGYLPNLTGGPFSSNRYCVTLLLNVVTGIPRPMMSYPGAVPPLLNPGVSKHDLASCVCDMNWDKFCLFDAMRAKPEYMIVWRSH